MVRRKTTVVGRKQVVVRRKTTVAGRKKAVVRRKFCCGYAEVNCEQNQGDGLKRDEL